MLQKGTRFFRRPRIQPSSEDRGDPPGALRRSRCWVLESEEVGHRAGTGRCGDSRNCCSVAGMRRSEVSALRWAAVVDATDGDGVLVTVRRSKTNPEGKRVNARASQRTLPEEPS